MPYLLLTLAEAENISIKLSEHQRFMALKQAEQYMMTHLYDNLHSKDICQVANVSQRTLEYIFRDYYGVTPKAYLKRLRLNQVHKRLKQADSQYIEIAAIAHEFGFSHLGQFAQDYKLLFGELPSETISNNAKFLDKTEIS